MAKYMVKQTKMLMVVHSKMFSVLIYVCKFS